MDATQEEAQRLEIYRIWRVLAAHRWAILSLTLVSSVVALGLTYVLPEVYEASALVMVRPLEEISLGQGGTGGKEILDFPVSQSAPIDAPSNTYMEVIKSRAVAQKIVAALNLDAPPERKTDFFSRLKDSLKDFVKTGVRQTQHYLRYGRVIPATPFERAVEDIEENLSVETKKNAYAFEITYQAGDPAEAAAIANAAAEIFLTHTGDAYRDESMSMREFLTTQLDDSKRELDQARADLVAFKQKTNTFSLDSEYNEQLDVISDLESTLELTEAKLAGLLRTYSPTNPKVLAATAEKAQLEGAITKRRTALAGHPDMEKQLSELESKLSAAEVRYGMIKKNYDEARIREQANADEIRIVSPATPPLYPVKPLKYMYTAFGALLALVIGISAALFIEYLNPRVRTVKDVSSTLGLAVLGAIPKMKGNNGTVTA